MCIRGVGVAPSRVQNGRLLHRRSTASLVTERRTLRSTLIVECKSLQAKEQSSARRCPVHHPSQASSKVTRCPILFCTLLRNNSTAQRKLTSKLTTWECSIIL